MRALVIALCLTASLAEASVPPTLAYSGRLLRADGTPEAGPTTIRFALYGAATGGTAAWSETQTLLLTADGAWGAQLGAVTPFPAGLFGAGQALFLELTVNGGAPLAPRQPLASVATALVARAVRGGEVDAARLRVAGHDVLEGFSTVRAFRPGSHVVTLPAGVTRVHVRAWGGGGAGGTTSSSSAGVVPGGGGGAGGYAEEVLVVSEGATLTLQVGAGGAASACAAPGGGASTVRVNGVEVLAAQGGGGAGHAAGCCPNGSARAGLGGEARGAVALEGEPGLTGTEGGEGGLNLMSGALGRGGSAVLRAAACSAGDAGRGGLVWLAY